MSREKRHFGMQLFPDVLNKVADLMPDIRHQGIVRILHVGCHYTAFVFDKRFRNPARTLLEPLCGIQ
jgi:hypothetical protein